ncbi:MAG: zinc-ribbon domain-containing protein [bacterium]
MLILTLAAICIGCISVMAAVFVCDKCSYENDAGSKFCSHCGAPFAAGTELNNQGMAANVPGAGQGAAGAVGAAQVVISVAVIEGELKAASEQMEKRNGWLALLYCENAMALNAIARTPKNLAERVLELHGKCEAGVRSSVKECRVCDGKGNVVRQDSSMSVEARRRSQTPINETCTACRGTGIVPGRSGLDALKHGYDSALKMYAVLRQGSRWAPVGNAWVPPDTDSNLSYRQIATLKRVTGSRCSICAGAGQFTCAKCSGSARLKCPSRTCSSGYVPKKIEAGLGTSGRVLMVRCGECDGRGTIKCSGCDGYGSASCKVCRGRGKLPICDRCDGDGLKRCTDCNGTGMQKKVICNGCRGCGNILCRSCMGSGRIRESD